jgi:AcrR family transcriptional regulator
MHRTRLDSEERRVAIVVAAQPLFARKGFAGTTTREIARAAGVSEALLFQHFPTKAALYQAIVAEGCKGDPELEVFLSLRPSTSTLVAMAVGMADHFLGGDSSESVEERDIKHRLICQSYLDDGEYGRLIFGWATEHIFPLFAASLEAAHAAGDLRDKPSSALNAFHFSVNVVAGVAYARLNGRDMAGYEGDDAALRQDAARFILRGFGVTEQAIDRHIDDDPCGCTCASPSDPDAIPSPIPAAIDR